MLLLPMELPDSILDHPIIEELWTLSTDMVALANASIRLSSPSVSSLTFVGNRTYFHTTGNRVAERKATT